MGRRVKKIGHTYFKNDLQKEYFSIIIFNIILVKKTKEQKNKNKQGKPLLSAVNFGRFETDNRGYRKLVNTHEVYLQTNNLQKCYMFIVLHML